MGKEIRVGLAVVGVLLVLFCALLARRLSQATDGPPDVSIPVTDHLAPVPPPVAESLRLRPTIIKGSAWDEPTSPTRGNPSRVGTGSANPVPDSAIPGDNPASSDSQYSNPRRQGEIKADPELTRPQDNGASAHYLPLPAPR